jgi:hypothetical protein
MLGLAVCVVTQPGLAVPTTGEVDIVGIKFGMSPDQVLAALKKNSAETAVLAKMTYKAGPGSKEGVASLSTCDRPLDTRSLTAKCADEITIAFTAGTQEAFYIRRKVAYDGKLRQQDLKAALEKKYGFVHANVVKQFGGTGETLYGAMAATTDGNVSYARINPAGCETAGSGPALEPTRASGRCYWAMVTESSGMGTRRDLVDSHTLAVTSHETLMRSLKLEQAARDNFSKMQNAEQDKRVAPGAPRL